MAKLKDCQFIEIKIDGNTVAGSSEEETYKNWLEGYAPSALATVSGPDSVLFEPMNISILMSKESNKLYEKYLNRGYKDVVITIVHRASDKLNQGYEAQRTVYDNCRFHSLRFEKREQMFMDVLFTFEESVEVTFNVPNTKDDGLDKVGPIKYNIPAKKIV
ncbi:hypothetical protein [Citrobacter gillenii]|uniref:Type VI secretion system tube protein Hcp n=1 Tax=Citrobacter gillenii TaxID=67828 RepID=A0ABD6M744_9ENTR|nr:hypothetical protein [Citrobacter gillenii]NTZ52933.1 hypothetical protein [Citrobacter gillenii]